RREQLTRDLVDDDLRRILDVDGRLTPAGHDDSEHADEAGGEDSHRKAVSGPRRQSMRHQEPLDAPPRAPREGNHPHAAARREEPANRPILPRPSQARPGHYASALPLTPSRRERGKHDRAKPDAGVTGGGYLPPARWSGITLRGEESFEG